MKPEIDLSVIESALALRGEATARQISADIGLETKDVTRTLNAMLNDAAVEREKRSNEYVYWLTATASPPAKPRAAAVAVQAAVKAQAPADTTEQLRESRANELALSQTIIEICCAIGRDPAVTTTGQLPQLVRDYIEAQVGSAERDLLAIHALLAPRVAAPPIDPSELKELDCAERAATMIDEAIDQISTLQQQLYAKDDELLAQAALVVDLRARIEAQVKQYQSETGLLAEKNQRLHAEIEHLRSQPAHAVPVAPEAYLVTRLFRDSRGKTVADSGSPTRHKSIDAASRKARSAIRGGYTRAEIRATTLVAVATLGAEIKVKTV